MSYGPFHHIMVPRAMRRCSSPGFDSDDMSGDDWHPVEKSGA
jgi:hypothetical protein